MTEAGSVATRRATIAVARTLDARGWAMLLAVTIGTNLIDFAVVAPGERPGAAFAAAAFLRVALVFWIAYALLRRLAGVPEAERITPAFFRLALLQIGLAVLAGLGSRAGFAVAGPRADLAGEWLVALIAMTLIGLLTIRLLAWHAALAVGAPFGSIGPVWRAQRGGTMATAIGFLVLVVPFAALHLALTLIAVRVPLAAAPHVALGIVDGVVQAGQLLLSLALAIVAWRAAGSIGAAPVEAQPPRR
jgi:hypothetical protein